MSYQQLMMVEVGCESFLGVLMFVYFVVVFVDYGFFKGVVQKCKKDVFWKCVLMFWLMVFVRNIMLSENFVVSGNFGVMMWIFWEFGQIWDVWV